jgi:hypothetical protein
MAEAARQGAEFEGLTYDQLASLLRLCGSPACGAGRAKSAPEALMSALNNLGEL